MDGKELVERFGAILNTSWACDISPDQEFVRALQDAIAYITAQDGVLVEETMKNWAMFRFGFDRAGLINSGPVSGRDIVALCEEIDRRLSQPATE